MAIPLTGAKGKDHQPITDYPDLGTDPHGELFGHNREIRVLNEIPCFYSAIVHIISCPFVLCNVTTVEPMHEKVVVRCDMPVKVLREPGPYCESTCCTTMLDVYMGLYDKEITDMAVNDSHGSPLLVSAQFTYRIGDPLRYSYTTGDVSKFLSDQAQSALRAVLAHYPFDINEEDAQHHLTQCLKKPSEEIADHLKDALQALVGFAGIRIDSFRLTTVRYEQSMAKLLLAKQEANAEVIARHAIADGTAGIVKETLERLSALGIRLSDQEANRFAMNLTMMLVNRGHSTLNIYDGAPMLMQPPPQLQAQLQPTPLLQAAMPTAADAAAPQPLMDGS